MTYRILFRTTNPSSPTQFVFLDSETHVQDLNVGDYVCVKIGDLARTD